MTSYFSDQLNSEVVYNERGEPCTFVSKEEAVAMYHSSFSDPMFTNEFASAEDLLKQIRNGNVYCLGTCLSLKESLH